MISVGTRDARISLGFGGGGRGMEETELEEGEACSYHINGDDVSTIDPDVAFCYIDDKIHDYLGHFQKDFEDGVVSAENLGAKFGGYGSFLPSIQRSPVCSHPRTPPKVHNYSLPKSPNNPKLEVKLEGGQRNNFCHTTSHSVGVGPASTGSSSLVPPKAPSAYGPVKQEVSLSFNQTEHSAPRHESAKKEPTPVSDLKTLKVRIKVGSDNLSTRKNAIYSGLGLDGTPSSSLDDSPSDSEGISHEPQDVRFESPTSILQIMTSFPVHEGMMSPLADDLICLVEKEKLLKEGRSVSLPRDNREKSGFLVNGTHSLEGGWKVSGVKTTKLVERDDFSSESKSVYNKDAVGLLSKKGNHIDPFSCEELVSKTLKLPILSNSFSTVKDVIESKEMDKKNLLKDKVFPGQAEDELMKLISNAEDSWVEKQKANLSGKVQGHRRVSSKDDVLIHPKEEGLHRGEKTHESVKADSNVFKGRKGINAEAMDQKVDQKATSQEVDDMRLLPGKEYPLPGEKRKPKECQRNLAAEFPKDSSRVGSSSVPKMLSTPVNSCRYNSDHQFEKGRDTDVDFIRDMEENQMDSLALPSEDKHKNSSAFTKGTSAVNNGLRERPSGKKIDKLSDSDSYSITAPNIAPRSGHGHISAGAPPTGDPALIEDNWVCCDKCQKWRLLPHGTNPDNLPEKWQCSMLNWLPGMNRCKVSEKETNEKTTTLIAQYQVPAPESQNHLPRNLGGITDGAVLAKSRNPDQNLEDFGLYDMPSGGKKKSELKELSSAANKDGSIHLANSTRKNSHASVKSRSLNDVNHSPLLSEPDLRQLSKSSDMTVEKQKHKHKEKHKILDPSTDGGDFKKSKIKSRRDCDPDFSRASKKIKTEVKHVTGENWVSDYKGTVGKAGPSSSSGFMTAVQGKNQIKKGQQDASISKSNDEVYLDTRSVDVGTYDSRGRPKKRKMKEFPDTQIHLGSRPTSGHYAQDCSPVVKEEFSENEYRKEKNARTCKSKGKESSISKGSGRTDKKGSHAKNQQLTKDIDSSLNHWGSNGMDSLKKDLEPVQVSTAATSSSSKVSSSQKTKSSFQELKGSPVESVSSSPMRILNPDRLTSLRKDLMGMDESQDAGRFATPKRSSDGDDYGGSDQYGTARKDKFSLESSVMDFQDRDSNHISGGKARGQVVPSPDVINDLHVNGALGSSGKDTRCPNKLFASNQYGAEVRENSNHYHANGSRPRESEKVSSSRSKDKNESFQSDLDMGEAKNSNVLNESKARSTSPGMKPWDGKIKGIFGSKSAETDNKYVGKKDFTEKSSKDSIKRESQSNFGRHDGQDVRPDAICKKDAVSASKQNLHQECDSERSSKRISLEKIDRVNTDSIRGKPLPLPPSGGAVNELQTRCPRPVAGSHKGDGPHSLQINSSEEKDVVKVQIQTRKDDSRNGMQHSSLRHPTLNGHRARVDAPSPARRDSSSQGSSALKEAKDLKHLADRVKNCGSTSESTGLYFQAAVKFLHAASLLESTNSESAKHNDMALALKIYRDTAKLCEVFCAHEYERTKDMAGAALAYKFMEVAYMRVIYSSHASASRDRLELQTALQIPPGESPSSSASDVDNLNNPTTVDKVTLPRGVSSPQVAGNHVAARNRPNFIRILNFAQDVNFAMEASKKSRITFAAANTNAGDAKNSEGISSIKRALDFNFQDIEGFLHLVRLAMDAIGR